MTKLDSGQGEGKTKKKYMWFGFGNYGGQPIQQIGGGIVRDPNLLQNTLQNSESERSPVVRIGATVIGFTCVVLLLVWGLALFIK